MPAPAPDPVGTIERFAELSALQDDAFADGDTVLRAAGLDEEAWEAIEARWLARLSSGGPDVEELSERFGNAYSATRQRLAAGPEVERVPDTLPSGAGFLCTEAQAARSQVEEHADARG